MTNDPANTQKPEWIALALSGGGFRATLFHLGVVRTLRDCGLLSKVKLISAVSGGSILAAHLRLNWSRYNGNENEFNAAAQELIKFVKRDIRNRILRRWLRANIFVFPRLFGFGNPTRILAQYYDRLYRRTAFTDLTALRESPQIHILATSLTTGALCRFTSSVFEVLPRQESHQPPSITTPRISLAVAASSAFPLFFPAVRIDNKTLHVLKSQFDALHFLTDGGVFDNLALHNVQMEEHWQESGGLLIVSNASANFDYKDNKYSWALSVSRNIRANDIIMHHLAEQRKQTRDTNRNVCMIELQGDLAPDEQNAAPPLYVQWAVRTIQTDLNAVSDLEIDALIRHAQAKTKDALRQWKSCSEKLKPWLPVGDRISQLRPIRFEKLFKRSNWRRFLILGILDSATWSTILIIIALFSTAFWGIPLMKRRGASDAQSVYSIQVIGPPDNPLPNARVLVTLDDEAKSKNEGRTNLQGKYWFSWHPEPTQFLMHLTIQRSGHPDSHYDDYIRPESETKKIRVFDD